MTHVILGILRAVADQIELDCKTNISVNDPTYASIVKVGRFQGDPVSTGIYIAVTGGDPEDPKYRDGIMSLEDMDDIHVKFQAREIGGGELWWRRFSVDIGCFFINDRFDEEDAAEYAYMVLSRVQNAIDNTSVNGVVGDDGEMAIKVYNAGNTFFQSGGPPTNYIFRGKVFGQCHTER